MKMQLTYELEKADLLAFQRYHFKTSPALKKMRRFLFLVLLVFVSFIAFDSGSLINTAVSFVFNLAVGASIVWVSTWAGNEYIFRRGVPQGKDNGQTGHHQLIIDEHKVIEVTSINEIHHQWKGVDRVEQNEEYIYIFIMPQAAHIIPKRAFINPGQAQQFFHTAKALHARAKQGGAAAESSRPVELETAMPGGNAMPVAYFDERARSPIERVFSE